MSARHRLRTLFFCAFLELGALMGMPMRPEQISELMHALNQPKLAQTIPDRTDDGDADETRTRPV